MKPISRREMLKQLGTTVGVAAVAPLFGPVRAPAQAAAAEPFITLTALEGETLRAIVARLIPADENGAGALEARADCYIETALSFALKAARPAYTAGLAAVNAQAQSAKRTAFAKLPPADQDAVLAEVQRNSAWFFNLVRTHTIQGTFSDPFYGGNRDFIGWKLIGYPGARMAVSADEQGSDAESEPDRKSAYEYAMFSKGLI